MAQGYTAWGSRGWEFTVLLLDPLLAHMAGSSRGGIDEDQRVPEEVRQLVEARTPHPMGALLH